MKVVILLVVVLMLGVVCAELGDEWDSFEGKDSSSSTVEVDVRTGVENVSVSDESGYVYTLDFYIALGVGAVGVLIVAVFVYFFLRKPKDKWKKGS